MKKDNFNDRFIKRFYGIVGPLDEYKRREANRIGNICFMFSLPFLLVASWLALLLADKSPKLLATYFPLAILAFFFVMSGFIMLRSRQAGLASYDPDELSAKERKQVERVGLRAGIYFASWFYLWNAALAIWLDKLPPVAAFSSLKTLCSALFAGCLFGLFSHFIVRKRQLDTE